MMRARAALAAATLLLAGAASAQTFPQLTGRVVDKAGILSPATEAQLTGRLAALESSTGIQLVVATLPSLQGYTIEDYGYRLGRAWGIGQAQEDDGAIFITAPAERDVRIEVGYGLGGRLTDLMSGVILRQHVLPRFRAGEMEAGVVAGTDALIQHLSLPADAARARVAQAETQAPRAAEEGGGSIIGLVITLLVLWFILSAIFGGRGRRRRRRGGGVAGDVAQVVLWSMLNSGGGGRGGGWGGGGGGFGGGGFRGGGGSFGGGGASGSW